MLSLKVLGINKSRKPHVSAEMNLKLVSLNIEGEKHLDICLPFIVAQQSDVVCLQEVFGVDVEHIAECLGMEYHFVPTMHIASSNKYNIAPRGDWGAALFTKLPHEPFGQHYYKGTGTIPEFVEPNSGDRVLLSVEVTKNEQRYVVATTHFTWSGNGRVHQDQREDFERLQQVVSTLPPHVLCGDFNSPRGGEMYTRFLQLYQDGLPSTVTTTIDGSLHYAGALELVVDTVFFQAPLVATVTTVVEGVSDHKGLVATVTQTE